MTCKDCKFFVQGERRLGTCMKHPYSKSRYGHIYKNNDGTPIKFYVSCNRDACKEHFERKDTECPS